MAFRSSIDLARGALVLALVLAGATAHAAEPETEHDALMRRGVALRREGRDAEALQAFELALASSATPRARAQIALAEQALALWLPAERDLGLALAERDDPWIRQNREALERASAIVAAKLAWITVVPTTASGAAPAPDAQVLVNGAPAARSSDGRIRVVAGQIAVELRAEGHAPSSRSVNVAPETTVKVALALGAPTTRAVATSPSPTGPSTEPVVPSSDGLRTVGWVLAGAGVLGLGVGGFFGARAIAKKDERDTACEGGCTQAGVDADRAGRTAGLVSTVAMAGGVVATSVGLVLVFTSPSRPAAPPPRSIGVGVNGLALDLRGSF